MFAHPPKYLLTIRCFFVEASVGASKKLASAIPVESTPAQSYQEKTCPLRFSFATAQGRRSAAMPHPSRDKMNRNPLPVRRIALLDASNPVRFAPN